MALLYVGRDKKGLCAGSVACAEVCARLSGVETVHVEGLSTHNLLGTPTLVDADGSDFVGRDALSRLLDMLVEQVSAEATVQATAPPPKRHSGAPPSADTGAPPLSARTGSVVARDELASRRSMQPALQLNNGRKKPQSYEGVEDGDGGDDADDAWPAGGDFDDEPTEETTKQLSTDDFNRAMGARRAVQAPQAPPSDSKKISPESD